MSFPSISNSGQPLQVRVTNLQGSRITSKAWILYPIWATITASLDYNLTSSLACNSNSLNVVLKNRSTKKEDWFHLAAAILSGGSLSTVFQIKMKWEIESWEKNPKNNNGNQYQPQPQAISSIPRLFGIWSVEFVGEGKPETQVKKNLGARMRTNIMWFQVWEWQTPITVVLSKHSHPCTIHHSHTYP